MSKKSEIFLSDGQSYYLSLTTKEAVEKLAGTDGKIKQELQSFRTTSEKEIFVNPSQVVAIADYHSPEDAPQTSSLEDEPAMEDDERKDHNLKEAQKFQEEIDDMK